MFAIGDLLRNNARRIATREALVSGTVRITWGALNSAVNRLANGLAARGIGAGERVAFILGNTPHAVYMYYALAKIGAVSVPIMPRSTAREIAHIVNDVSAAAIVAAADQAAAVREGLTQMPSLRLAAGVGPDHGLPVDFSEIADGQDREPDVAVDPESLYAIQFTSGTTGAPKGCMLTHRAKVLSRMSMLSHVGYNEDDRALLFMPLMAGLGADMLHAHVLRGLTTVLMQRFDESEMLALIEGERISVLYVVESTFDRLVAHERLAATDWSSVRYFLATSATRDVSSGMAKLQQARSFRARLWNGYGCTEGGGWLTYMSPEEIAAAASGANHEHLRTIGRESMLANVDCVDASGATVSAGEIGEMVLRAPWLASGYWGLPEKTAEVFKNGGYYTGDLARKDADGYVYLEGRMKDMIKTGGVNVYPAEIEMIMKEHPGVQEVAVVGVPDAEWGEKVVACVIPRGECAEADLLAHCKRALAGYKVPKSVSFVADFPRDVVGKILKRELRNQWMAAHLPRPQ